MNIKIITVGKLKEKYLKAGIAEYAKRLSKFCKFEIIEVSDEKAPESLSEAEMTTVKDKEGERILAKVKDKEHVIVLAIHGKQRALRRITQKKSKIWPTYGTSDITFIIGAHSEQAMPSINVLTMHYRLAN